MSCLGRSFAVCRRPLPRRLCLAYDVSPYLSHHPLVGLEILLVPPNSPSTSPPPSLSSWSCSCLDLCIVSYRRRMRLCSSIAALVLLHTVAAAAAAVPHHRGQRRGGPLPGSRRSELIPLLDTAKRICVRIGMGSDWFCCLMLVESHLLLPVDHVCPPRPLPLHLLCFPPWSARQPPRPLPPLFHRCPVPLLAREAHQRLSSEKAMDGRHKVVQKERFQQADWREEEAKKGRKC